MEYDLFFIGLAMGVFAWFSRRRQKAGGPGTPTESALLRGLFYFLAGASITVILSASLETPEKFVMAAGHAIPIVMLRRALLIGGAAGAIGFWRAWTGGGKAEKRRAFLH